MLVHMSDDRIVWIIKEAIWTESESHFESDPQVLIQHVMSKPQQLRDT